MRHCSNFILKIRFESQRFDVCIAQQTQRAKDRRAEPDARQPQRGESLRHVPQHPRAEPLWQPLPFLASRRRYCPSADPPARFEY